MSTTPNRNYPIPSPSKAIHPEVRDSLMAIDADVNSLSGGVAAALADPDANGMLARTSLGVTAARFLAQPAAGLTISNSDGVAGNPTFALSNDLAALEGLTGTGFPKRTGADAWSIGALSSGDIPDISTTYATRTYADSLVVGLVDDRGNYDASGNTFPASGGSGSAGAILKGDLWFVSVAGTLGGVAVNVGDQLRALVDAPGQTASNWAISEANIGYVPANSTRSINVSGLGLSGGGNLTADRTITLTSSSDPGVAQSILATDASGFLSLVKLNTDTLADRSGGNLSIAPAGDIVFNPTGKDLLPNTGYNLNLGSISKKYLTIHAAELRSGSLVAESTSATIGGRILVGPTTSLIADVGTGDTTIDVKHNEMTNGDRVYLEADNKVEFMAVTSGPTTITGGFRYSVTRNLDGSGANQWFAGDAVFNTGQTGDGFIDLYSLRGVKSASEVGPTIAGNIRNSSTYNDWSPRWAIGNLNGLYGYSADTYGVAFGVPSAAHILIDPTNGIRIRHNTTNKITLDASGNATFAGSITSTSGTVGGWAIGSTKLTGLDGVNDKTLELLSSSALIQWIKTSTANPLGQITASHAGNDTTVQLGSMGSGSTGLSRTQITSTNNNSSAIGAFVLDAVGSSHGSFTPSSVIAKLYGLTGTFLGLTIGDSAAPNAMLDVRGTARFSGAVSPNANDGAALGIAGLGFSDLFLAEGGVINWDNGDATLTQSGDGVTLSGASLGVGISPAYPLHVKGSIVAQGLTGNADFAILTADGTTGFWDFATEQSNNGRFLIYDAISAKMPFAIEKGAPDNSLYIHANGSVVLGAPTGGPKGAGSINAVTVWRNGTALDYVFEDSYNLLSIDRMASYFREHKHLPTIPTREVHDEGSTNMGALTDKLWETVEVQARYISELHERLKVLECRV